MILFLSKEWPQVLDNLSAVIVPSILENLIDSSLGATENHMTIILINNQILNLLNGVYSPWRLFAKNVQEGLCGDECYLSVVGLGASDYRGEPFRHTCYLLNTRVLLDVCQDFICFLECVELAAKHLTRRDTDLIPSQEDFIWDDLAASEVHPYWLSHLIAQLYIERVEVVNSGLKVHREGIRVSFSDFLWLLT